MTARKKLCRACADAKTVCTGSQIFYLCKFSGQYRSVADYCNLELRAHQLLKKSKQL